MVAGAGAGPQQELAATDRPNIVFVLTDDLTWNLVTRRYMPHVIQLERRGQTFVHYIVANSLCCPSRASIFTGLFPHDTGVFTNSGADGGLYAFIHQTPSLETKTYAVALKAQGYETSLMGKYLNGYGEPEMMTYIPSGWTDWHVGAKAYPEFDYDLNENGRIVHFGGRTGSCGIDGNPNNYGVDVLAARATSFIARAASDRKPFFLEVSTYAPHGPYTPAPRNACDFPGLKHPRDPSFNTNNVNPPSWLGPRPKLKPKRVREIDRDFRMRAQAVEAIDQLLADIETALATHDLARNTYIVFSSDNGYHMGQHRLLPGKKTAFDTDIRVPLIVAGPGVPQGRIVSQVAQNIDLYPTFLELTGSVPDSTIDGHSLVPLLNPTPSALPPAWRTVALVEHHQPTTVIGDPDFENGKLGGSPASYGAIRLSGQEFGNAVYVEYTAGSQREYYDIDRDPFERHNVYGTLSASRRKRLHALLVGLENCHGAACWAAGRPQP